ncbi:MAG TPA: rhomboid family intramembrane serine protease [Tepidisphaeraceae bacterium]|jgi:membrane associated rhomboid family serine protease
MAFADRQYSRRGPDLDNASNRPTDTPRMGPVTLWLIILNIAVAVLDPILSYFGINYLEPVGPGAYAPFRPLFGLGYFSLQTTVYNLELWRVITFQFLHAGVAHLLFNMLALYFFGPLVEAYLGSRRYLAFYLLCGMGGPFAYMVLWKAKFLIVSPAVTLVGASAGIFGVLIAAAQIAPDATVLIYGILPIRLKTLAWVLLAIAIYTVLAYGSTGRHNAGGEAAHLGGALVGYILIHNPNWLNIFEFRFLEYRRRPPF